MISFQVIFLTALLGSGIAYIPPKDQFFADSIFREVVERLGKDLREDDDLYLDLPEVNRLIPNRQNDEQEDRYSLDYDSIEGGNSNNPSLRDQEFLQHSSLWGHHYITGGTGQGTKLIKEIKTDATLPAYCNPPNPCPAGESSSTASAPCIDHFDNTASFSRDYQAAQDCMCDAEHMFTCPSSNSGDGNSNRLVDTDLDRLIQQFQVDQHKSLVAKKFHVKKSTNPFLEGEKLPVAAKKGINVSY